MKISAYVCGLVAMLALAGQGETYTWARMSSDGKNFEGGAWETLSYWTVGEGATPETYPGEGDTIVLPSDLGTGIGCQMKALTLTTSVNERSAGTVIGGRNYEIVLSVPRSSGQNQYRMVKIENPNGFAGAWRTSQPRTLMYFANDSSFTPRLAVLETQSRPYVNVTNAGATVKIGLLKAKNDSSSYSSNGGTRYTAGGAISKIGNGILEIEEGGGIEERVYLDAGSLVLDGKAKPTASLESILSRAWLRLDATRRDTMKTYEGDDGRLYVTNWADVNGSARAARIDDQQNIPTWDTDFVTAPKAPFISPVKSGTDRDLMDFGSESATYEETLGPRHCYLRFDTCSQVRELFIVRWRTDPYNLYSSVIGHSTQYPLHCNGNYSLFSTAASASVLRGEVRINGITSFYGSQPVDSYSDGMDTMHLLNVAPTNAIALNLLGSERYFSARSGGCRIGEVLIFTEKLSDGERAQVNEYLMKKWFKGYVPCEVGAVSMRTGTSIEVPEGRIARVRRISLYGDTLVKTGGGTLVVDSISPTNAKLDIRGGDIKINPADDDIVTDDAPAASPLVWLDATQAATLVCSNSEDGTTAYLTNWTDRAGGPVSATIPWDHAYFVNHFPTIKADVPSAGDRKSVV